MSSKLNRTFILTGFREYLKITVYMKLASFTQIKRS